MRTEGELAGTSGATTVPTMTPTVADRSERLAFADGLRGLAALWVVLFHMSIGNHVPQLKAWLPGPVADALFDRGDLGVAVFFVVSGFVMALTVRNARVDARNAFRFAARRLVRLTPPYYFAILVAIALFAAKARVTGSEVPVPGMRSLLAHATYTQDMLSIPHINSVFWTLCIEVQFYLAFAGLMFLAERLRGRFDVQAARLWLLLATGAGALAWPLGWLDDPLWTGGFLPYWPTFVAGALACHGRLPGTPRRVAVVFCGVLGVAGHASAFLVTAAITAAAILAAERAGKMNVWFRWRWLETLAAISYSLYLLHNMIMGGGFRLVHPLVGDSPFGETVAALFVLALCLATASLAFWSIERPAIRWSRTIRFETVEIARAQDGRVAQVQPSLLS